MLRCAQCGNEIILDEDETEEMVSYSHTEHGPRVILCDQDCASDYFMVFPGDEPEDTPSLADHPMYNHFNPGPDGY